MMAKILAVFGWLLIVPALTAPTDDDHSLIVSSTVPSVSNAFPKKENEPATKTVQIYQMQVKSRIGNRFAHTTVTSRVRNYGDKSQEVAFSLILPDSAFISGFIMEVGGKNYTAQVKEKEEAIQYYEQAVSSGIGAAHVAVSARDSNRFTVSVNVEPETKAAFYLIYEQLLKRQDDHYEHVINIHPGQPVKDLSVEVLITESRKIIDLKALPLRSGNEIDTDKLELDPQADVNVINDTSAIVTFSPSLERQKQFAQVLGTEEDNGLSGQFVIQYDAERDPNGGEVLIQDGYFVHFFAPTDLKPLPKQVVFVLDSSGSMSGQKIEQLKQAMLSILDQLNEQDIFNLVEFNSNTKVWNIEKPEESVWYPDQHASYYCTDYQQNLKILKSAKFPRAYHATAENIKKAKHAISAFEANGATGMLGALQVALRLVEIERVLPSGHNAIKYQPIVMFLTDGQPTDSSPYRITTKITEFNSKAKRSVLFALSFGDGADKNFLQKLAILNSGFSRHIYEAADAALQLEDFYRQISSPLLSQVRFKYEPSITSLTSTSFPIHFGGSEIVVAGFCGTKSPSPVINGIGAKGAITLKPSVSESVTNTERLWAYVTIKQLLENKEEHYMSDDEVKKQALELALKYNFVTPVSSLVVVKPNDTSAVNTEEAKNTVTSNERTTTLAPFLTTPHCFIPPIATTDLDVLFDALPWLSGVLDNELITTPQGSFKLGLNETFSDVIQCSKTPFDKEGHCALLHKCPQVHSILETSLHFFDHFCTLKDEFAGICCPN